MDATLFITTKEAAVLMDVTQQTVNRYCRDGVIEATRYRDGGDWRINRDRFFQKYPELNKSNKLNN